jgi:Tfp pilus assembly protein PilO
VVDLGVTQPRARELRALHRHRTELFAAVRERAGRGHESEMLKRRLAGDGLADQEGSTPVAGPLSHIDALLSSSDLTRLELSTIEESSRDGLQRTQLQVRVVGDYAQILDFTRRIERGQRLVVIDAFSIEATESARALEGRFNISIYDPEGGI